VKKCRDCKTEIDDNASKCPSCRADQRNWLARHPIIGAIGIITTLGILSSVISPPSKSAPQENSDTESAAKSAPSPTPTEGRRYAINENVRVGDVRWKLVSARDRGAVLKGRESNYPSITKDKTSSAGKYVELTIEVENLGKDLKSVSNLKVIDSKGREFTSSSDVSDWVPRDKGLFLLSSLNPNIAKQFTDIYEIPVDGAGLNVRVGDLSFLGTDYVDIALGF
jgi:hypothetical protein